MQVPRQHDGRALRHVLLSLALLLAGCTLPEEGLEAASLQATGRVELGGALALLDARVTAAPDDAPAADVVELAGQASGRTRLHRDAWVLVVELREVAAGSAAGDRVASLEWNGELRPAIRLTQRDWGDAPEGATLRFDLGPRLEPSSLYVLRVAPAAS